MARVVSVIAISKRVASGNASALIHNQEMSAVLEDQPRMRSISQNELRSLTQRSGINDVFRFLNPEIFRCFRNSSDRGDTRLAHFQTSMNTNYSTLGRSTRK